MAGRLAKNKHEESSGVRCRPVSASYLFDINVLIALMWPAHEAHRRVQEWFRVNASAGWATCPITQAGFVRIISDPAFSADAVRPQEAVSILESNLKHPHHHFWPDDVSFLQAVRPSLERLNGRKHVTDAYLLGLVAHKKAKLVSLDSGILELSPDKRTERELVVIL
jgi:uncharacterized protein